MANVWVVDSNCFIHIGSMAREGFLDDLNKVLKSSETSLYVTPGVHDEVRTVRFQRWKGQPNLLEKMQNTLVTVSVDEAEVRALARHIGEKASPQDVDLSLMILGSKLAHEGNKVTLVSDDYKMTTTGEKANLNFETCPPSTFLQRLANMGSKSQSSRFRSLSRRVRAAEMRYAISRAGQYDIQSKLTWMVDSLISSKPAFSEDREELSQSDEAKLVSALIRSIRGERVKKSMLTKLGNLPDVCKPVSKLDEHLANLASTGSSDDIMQSYEQTSDLLGEILEVVGIGLSPMNEELAEIAHRAMSGSIYRIESALGMLAKLSGDMRLSRLHLSRALSSATLISDTGAEMRAMHQLGLLALASGNWNRASKLFESADRQAQAISANRIANLVLASIARHIDGDEKLSKSHLDAANKIVLSDKNEAAEILSALGSSLLAIDCPGLAIEVLDEAMECAIESEQIEVLESLADTILLANTAMTEKEQIQYEGLRQLLDTLNSVPDEVSEEFESTISDIDKKTEELSKPLDETWSDWQDANKLIPDNSSLTVLRIDEDESGRALIVSHHPEIGSLGLWMPDGGIQAAPGNKIQIHNSRIKVAPPTEKLQEMHNIRGIVGIENQEAISFIADTDQILDDEIE